MREELLEDDVDDDVEQGRAAAVVDGAGNTSQLGVVGENAALDASASSTGRARAGWIDLNSEGSGYLAARPAWRPVTKYEKRGVEELGHDIFDLCYQRAHYNPRCRQSDADQEL
eukprot:4326510-Pyramimonas_sp.AAC.1